MESTKIKVGQVWKDNYEGGRHWFVADYKHCNHNNAYVSIAHVSQAQDFLDGKLQYKIRIAAADLPLIYTLVQEAPEDFLNCQCKNCQGCQGNQQQ